MVYKNVPNDEQIKEFDKYIEQWQEILYLGDWRIERGLRKEKTAMASVICDNQSHLAVYRIGQFGAAEINAESLSSTALHECLHVFLFDLLSIAQDHTATQEQIGAEEHKVINVLEKLLKRNL